MSEYMSVKEIAETINLSEITIRTYICRPELSKYIVTVNRRIAVLKENYPIIKEILPELMKRNRKKKKGKINGRTEL